MKGGKRDGAGRNALDGNVKKSGHKVYLTDEEKYMIDEYGIGASFSERCANLVSDGLFRKLSSKDITVRFVDLFAGLGGIRIGLERAFNKRGIATTCVMSSEIKAHAIHAYKSYFGDSTVRGDIAKIHTDAIPSFDFLLAGFPCQPFSFAGKGLGFSDTRGTLFFEIERILKAKKPYGFLLENVEGLVSHDEGKTLATIMGSLQRLGYRVKHHLLDGKDFGLAQSRRRLYIVGTLDTEIDASADDYTDKAAVLKNILEIGKPTMKTDFTKRLCENFSIAELAGKAIRDKRGGSDNIHSWDIGLKGETSYNQRNLLTSMLTERRKKKWAADIGIAWMDGMPLTLDQIKTFFDADDLDDMIGDLVDKGYLVFEHPKKLTEEGRVYDTAKPKGYNIVAGKLSFEFTKILDPDDVAPTLVATDVSRLGVIDGNGIRQLTVREGLRLFGFPDNYNLEFLKSSQSFDLLGNTVCVPIIEMLCGKLARAFEENQTIAIKKYNKPSLYGMFGNPSANVSQNLALDVSS
jgi:DNA (cytosine-5)-methyltransferase 1